MSPVRADEPFPAKLTLDEFLAKWQTISQIPVDRSGFTDLGKTVIIDPKERSLWRVLNRTLEPNGLTALPTGKGDKLILVRKASSESQLASDEGSIRFAVKKVINRYDVESNRRSCEVQFVLHVDPKHAVFRIGGLTAKGTSWPDLGRSIPLTMTADGSKANVVGSQHPLTITTSLERKQDRVDLSGSITVTMADKRLRFAITDLSGKRVESTQEEVRVSLTKFEKKDDLHEAMIELTYPAGMPAFESFEEESWLRDTACYLLSPDRTKRIATQDFQVKIMPRGALVTYRFAEDQAKGIRPGPGWSLEVETPSPLRDVTVPFSFRGIPVP